MPTGDTVFSKRHDDRHAPDRNFGPSNDAAELEDEYRQPPDNTAMKIAVSTNYILYISLIFIDFIFLIGLILAYMTRNASKGTIYESHFSNQISSFWISIAYNLLGKGIVYIIVNFDIVNFDGKNLPGNWLNSQAFPWDIVVIYCAGTLVAWASNLWFLYRSCKGLLWMIESRPFS